MIKEIIKAKKNSIACIAIGNKFTKPGARIFYLHGYCIVKKIN